MRHSTLLDGRYIGIPPVKPNRLQTMFKHKTMQPLAFQKCEIDEMDDTVMYIDKDSDVLKQRHEGLQELYILPTLLQEL